MDGKPVHLFFLIVAPPHEPGSLYMVTLGKIAEICRKLIKTNEYMKVETPDEFIKLIKNLEEK